MPARDEHGHIAADLAARFADLLAPDDVITGNRLKARHSGYCARSLDAGVLLRPRHTAQLAAICQRAHAAGIPLVPQGGLTGLVDGTASQPGELVLSFEHLNRVLDIDARQGVVVAEAGVTLQALDDVLAPHGLMIGVDIAARGSCTLGGMVATNAGGARVLRYGMTRHNVLGLEVVLANGEVLDLMGPLVKNNAGYDLKQLFIGSEGTLGLVCKVALRLWPRPGGLCTALVCCRSDEQLLQLFTSTQVSLGPALHAFEAMWPRYYALTSAQPGFGNRPLPLGAAVYAVIEVAAASQAQARATLLRSLEAAYAADQVVDAAVAQSDAEHQTIWRAREDSDAVERAHDRALTYDVGLPLGAMSDFVSAVEAAFAAHQPQATLYCFGHVGDGNLHVMLGLPRSAAAERDAVDALLYRTLARYPGSTVSAEHGIGLEKREQLAHVTSAPALAVMQAMKRGLDPQNILNPGKVLRQA